MERAKPLSDTVPTDAFDVAVDMLTRDKRRSRRAREVRKKTISIKRMTKRELLQGAMAYPVEHHGKPCTRGECADVARPCPFVSCRWHLFLDVQPRTGAIILNFPDLEPDELAETCALDVADRGGETLEVVGAVMNLVRERVRQVEVKAFHLLHQLQDAELIEHVADEKRTPARVHHEDQ